MQKRKGIGSGGPCRECGSDKAIWVIGHPLLMTQLFNVGPTENVRLCQKCQAKYRGMTEEELEEIIDTVA